MSIPPQKPLYEALLPDSDKINQLQNFFTRPVLGTFYSNAENACKSLQILEEPEQLRWYKNYIYLYQLYAHYAEKLQPSDADTLSIQEELTSLRQQLERTKVNESTIFKTWKSLSAENDDLHTEIAKLRHQLQNSASAVNRQPQQEQEITSLKSQIQELTSRCHNLGERLENSYATIKKLKEEASSAKEKLRQAETEIAVQPEQSSSPQEEFLQLQRENWELRNQNQMLAQSSLSLRQIYSSVMKSFAISECKFKMQILLNLLPLLLRRKKPFPFYRHLCKRKFPKQNFLRNCIFSSLNRTVFLNSLPL